MTRKDYRMIAACFAQAEADPRNDADTLFDIERRITNELEFDNPRFDLARFRAYVDELVKTATGQ